MKRFIVVTALFSASIPAAWAIFDAFAASPPETKSVDAPIMVQDEIDELLEARQSGDLVAHVSGTDTKIAPVIDNTGAVVSDHTGTS